MSINAPDPSYGEGYAPFNGPPDDLSLHQGLRYHFDATLGKTGLEAKDVSGRQLLGTMAADYWADSEHGSILQMDEDSERVVVTNTVLPVLGMTAVIHARPLGVAAAESQYITYGPDGNNGWRFNSGNGSIFCDVEDTIGSYEGRTTPNGTLTTGTWYSLAFTIADVAPGALAAATDIAIYRNGQRVDTTSVTVVDPRQPPGAMWIGSRNGTNDPSVDIARVSIWDRVLPLSQIRYMAGKPDAITRLAPMPSPVTTGVAPPATFFGVRSINAPEPSYAEGYAPFNGPPENPSLWPDHGWIPSLGVTGQEVKNIAHPGVFDATFNSAVRPTWDTSGIPQSSGNRVLEWDDETVDSFLVVGDILTFRFLRFKPWTVIASGSIGNSASDDRAIIAKTGGSGATIQFLLRTDQLAAPTNIEVYHRAAVKTITGANIIALNTWYTWAVTCAGTGTADDLQLFTFDRQGKLLESPTGTTDADNNTLDTPIELWGWTNNDEFVGLAGPTYFYERKLSLDAIALIARDNLAPVRLAPMPSPVTTGAAPPAGNRRRRMFFFGASA